MKSDLLVSVIIPAYNAEEYVGAALRSVLEQDCANFEVLVVDDGSLDETAACVAQFCPPVLYLRQANSGSCSAPRNLGIKHSNGEYLCFLDADDIMLPGRLRKQSEFLSRHRDVGVVFMDYRNCVGSIEAEETHFQECPLLWGALRGTDSLILSSSEATSLLMRENFGIASSMMVRREVLDAVPGFAEDLRACEDFHFYYRIARQYRVGIINALGVLRRMHEDNMSGDRMRMLQNYIRSRRDLLDTESNSGSIKLLKDFLCRVEIDLARTYAERGEFGKAVFHNVRAIAAQLPESLKQCGPGLRALCRTVAMILRLKKA